VGHSLGGAIALLDALALRAVLPPHVGVRAVGYGTPRVRPLHQSCVFLADVLTRRQVGNAEFAEYAAEVLGANVTVVAREHDPVPRLPPTLFGYSPLPRPCATLRIDITGRWVPACDHGDISKWEDEDRDEDGDGDEAEWVQDEEAEVWEVSLQDHTGPFDGVWMGCGGV